MDSQALAFQCSVLLSTWTMKHPLLETSTSDSTAPSPSRDQHQDERISKRYKPNNLRSKRYIKNLNLSDGEDVFRLSTIDSRAPDLLNTIISRFIFQVNHVCKPDLQQLPQSMSMWNWCGRPRIVR